MARDERVELGRTAQALREAIERRARDRQPHQHRLRCGQRATAVPGIEQACAIALQADRLEVGVAQEPLRERRFDRTLGRSRVPLRQRGDLEKKPEKGAAQAAAVIDPAAEKQRKEELQGVFVVNKGKAEFRKVETGITGTTDIEVLSGVNADDEIVTGTYQVIRTLRNQADIKVDNRTAQQKT